MVEQGSRQPGTLSRSQTFESSTDGIDRKQLSTAEVKSTDEGVSSTATIPERQQSITEAKAAQFIGGESAQAYNEIDREQHIQSFSGYSRGIPAAGRQASNTSRTFAERYTGNWISEKRNLQKEIDAYKHHLKNAQAHIQHLEGVNDEIETEREQLESDLRRLQKHAFQRFESPDWKPASNAEIRRKLNQLDSEVKAWSKANCMAHFYMLTPTEHPIIYKEVGTALQDFAKLDDEMNLIGVPDDKAWVLLQAFIMHNLYFDIFDHPFFGISSQRVKRADASANEENPGAQSKRSEAPTWDFGLSLQVLYHKFRACNAQEAVAWRVQTLRQLHPVVHDSDPRKAEKTAICRETVKHREEAVISLASGYLNSGIRALLLSPDKQEMKDSLAAIVLKAADLSFSLWTQKIDLLPQSLKHMDEGFAHNHPLMDAHQLHSKHLDDDPANLDCLPILLITHPALVRFGDEEARDFSVRTVLKKAVCWMGQLPECAE
ncbi:hypothetical protein BKA66DRAFT_477295 [Pyrenochaeta sp. MPI-SDFR-AT-0127]|nr:hypothetical protein BKA66DRAFT_477295 [Pyrenochaeta sp. MPI-SDFR-AT-0127]